MKLYSRRKQEEIELEKQIGEKNREWKEKNKKYLKELQIFFDRVDNVKDSELRQSIISQMLICDEVLTKIAEEKFNVFYNEGYKKAKDG